MQKGIALGLALCLLGTGVALASETVTIAGFSFSPPVLTVAAGTTVVWVNDDVAPHTVVISQTNQKSPKLVKGASFSETFSQPGTFDYICGLHRNMTGKIIVTP